MYALIAEEAECEEAIMGSRPRKSRFDRLEELWDTLPAILEQHGQIFNCYQEIRFLLGIRGYNEKETQRRLNRCLDQMVRIASRCGSDGHHLYSRYRAVLKAIRSFRTLIPSLTARYAYLYQTFHKEAERLGISMEAFIIRYHQAVAQDLDKQCEMEEKLEQLVGLSKRAEFEQAYQDALASTHSASSMVENLNGRIRKYIYLKRVLGSEFLITLKVFFNTRKTKRSRIKEFVGTSPAERMTGQYVPDFYALLEQTGFYEKVA